MKPQSSSQPGIDASASLKSGLEALEFWRKNYENVIRNLTEGNMPDRQIPATQASLNQNMAVWQKSFEAFYQPLASLQIELFQLFNQRLEEYLGLPVRAAQCKTFADVGQLQMAFFNKMVSDCADEMRRLQNPFAEIMASWRLGQAAPGSDVK